MNILIETLLISTCMLGLGLVPLVSTHVRRYSKFFYLFGTGALAGILIFDLLPDIFEMGGKSTLWGVAIVWLVYSLIHLIHLKQHKSDDPFHFHGQSRSFFSALDDRTLYRERNVARGFRRFCRNLESYYLFCAFGAQGLRVTCRFIRTFKERTFPEEIFRVYFCLFPFTSVGSGSGVRVSLHD